MGQAYSTGRVDEAIEENFERSIAVISHARSDAQVHDSASNGALSKCSQLSHTTAVLPELKTIASPPVTAQNATSEFEAKSLNKTVDAHLHRTSSGQITTAVMVSLYQKFQ